MKRFISDSLQAWNISKRRKPLVLKGARQVGKTFSLIEFGKENFEKNGHAYHYIDFKKHKDLYSAFEENINPNEIIRLLQFKFKRKIDTKNDLLIFDEIQECPFAITSFKYFEQEMKELSLIGAGSHLGLIKNEESFPVGKVNFLYMFPMTFEEFIMACDHGAYLEFEKFFKNIHKPLPTIIHNRLMELLRYYFFTGGLPEVVQNFIDNFKINELDALKIARDIQLELVEGYKADFSKYSKTVNANHIHSVFEAIPMQLSLVQDEEVRKFKFKNTIKGHKGFANIQGPLGWLTNSRLCLKNMISNGVGQPLKGFCKDSRFKVFMFDIGILNCMLDTAPEVIVSNELGTYKGFLAENFIAQEIFAVTNGTLYSWQEGRAEIEFLLSLGKEPIPMEVKSSSRSRRAKSLDSYIQKYNPPIAYKLTGQNYGYNQKKKIVTLPLYLISKILSRR